jgi:hypothetical protein
VRFSAIRDLNGRRTDLEEASIMSKLLYSVAMSLDGLIAGHGGDMSCSATASGSSTTREGPT